MNPAAKPPRIVRERSFYVGIATIALPMVLQNIIILITQLADTVMLGFVKGAEGGRKLCDILVAASQLANQPFFLLSMVCFGLSGGATVLVSQYWGKRDMDSIRSIISLVVKAAFGLSTLMGLAVLLYPEAVMRLFTVDDAIVRYGVEYLRIMGFAYFLFGVGNTFLCSIRSVELVNIAVVVNISSLITNMALNWLLIFGNCGFPALGIRGAAIATLIARVVEFIITIIYIFCVDKRLAFRPRHLLSMKLVFVKDFFRYGSPVLINEVMWALAISLQASILGHIGYAAGNAVSANALVNMIQQMSTTIIFGVANAAAILVGKAIGENDFPKAEQRAHTFKYISVVFGLLASLVILLTRDAFIGFYRWMTEMPEDTLGLAREMMAVMAVVVFFISISAISIVGILRGAGDTLFCLFIEMFTLWGIAVPLALLASKVWFLPVPLVFALMKVDEALKALFCMLRMRGKAWLRSVTRDMG